MWGISRMDMDKGEYQPFPNYGFAGNEYGVSLAVGLPLQTLFIWSPLLAKKRVARPCERD